MTGLEEGVCRPPAFYTMEFTGAPLPGLVIRVRGLDGDGMVALHHTEATVDDPMAAVPLFMEQVDSWNLKYADGGSVPATFEGLMKHDPTFVRALVSTWVRDILPLPYPSDVPAVPVSTPTPAAAAVDEFGVIEPREVDEDDIALSNLRVFSRSVA